MTAVVLQARIDSSRLPGKALLPLGGKPVVLRVMEALNHIHADMRILACPEDSRRDFEPLVQEACAANAACAASESAHNAGFEIFTGPKDDVLKRFCDVIKKYSITRLIRATGDNPFVFIDAASVINNEATVLNADYAGYAELPYGAGVESVNAPALLRAENESSHPYDHEHVCPYLYNNPQIFNIHRLSAPVQWRYPDIRLTIDTQEDYEHAQKLYCALPQDCRRYNGETIIKKYLEIFH